MIRLLKHNKTSNSPGRLFLTICLLAISAVLSHAQLQKSVVQNRPYIDQRRFHYGFLAGINMQDLEFENNGYTDASGNQWFTDVASYEPGFSVGILAEFYINKHLAFRVIPSMHFGTKNATFKNHLNGVTEHQEIKTTYISVPLDLKISGQRYNNYRPYAMVGIDPMYNLTIKRQKNLLFKPMNFFIEAGMGCDFYLPFFKFIPEIKFCYGLSNILDKKRTDLTDETKMIFTQSLESATSKMIIVTFYFE